MSKETYIVNFIREKRPIRQARSALRYEMYVKRDLYMWIKDYSKRNPNLSKETYIMNFECEKRPLRRPRNPKHCGMKCVSNRTNICEKDYSERDPNM